MDFYPVLPLQHKDERISRKRPMFSSIVYRSLNFRVLKENILSGLYSTTARSHIFRWSVNVSFPFRSFIFHFSIWMKK